MRDARSAGGSEQGWQVQRLIDRMTDRERTWIATRSPDGYVARVERTQKGAYDLVLELPREGTTRIASRDLFFRVDQHEAQTTETLQDLEELFRELDPDDDEEFVEIEPRRARLRLAAERADDNPRNSLAQMLVGQQLLLRYEDQNGEEIYVAMPLAGFKAAFEEAFG
jgi:hypothetical protein